MNQIEESWFIGATFGIIGALIWGYICNRYENRSDVGSDCFNKCRD